MRPFLAMLLANLKMTTRNISALFWNLAFPAIFIVVFGAVFQDGNLEGFEIGIAGAPGQQREAVTAALSSSDAFVIHEGTEAEELDNLRSDDRDVVLVFPENPADGVDLYSSDGSGPNGQIAVGATSNVVYEVLGGQSGVLINAKPISTLDTTFIDWFVPGIIAMSLMNTGIIGIATSFLSFREKGILRRIKVTPFPLWQFLVARIVAALIMSLVTTGILLTIGKLAWGLTVRGNWGVIGLAIIISALAMIAIGYAIAAIARNTEAAAAYANMLTFPMMFLSGVFFPIGSMPGWLQPLIKIMPLTYAADALRQPMLYGHGLSSIATPLIVLAGIFVVALAFAIRFFRWDATSR